MINWLISHPVICGLITSILMWIDWILTIVQERERQNHYFKHYESYPINTIEGNPAFRDSVTKMKIFYPKHFISSLIIGTGVGFAIAVIPEIWRDLFMGYILGIFLIVIAQHINNLIGYIASRQGIHGKLKIHLRTSYAVQAGRYFSISILLFILAILSSSHFIYGVTIAGFFSALRQLIWMKKSPMISTTDRHEFD
jgi:hypothetical protein